MKKILYLSCHCVLEYDELRLLNDLGYDVFTNDAYHRPQTPVVNRRPSLPIVDKDDYLNRFYDMCHVNSQNPNINPEQYNNLLTEEMIEPFDIIMIMHLPRFIEDNWKKIKHKTVIWRTIGQSTAEVESKIKKYRDEGLRIIRYSPKEIEIPNYVGGDALIRFAKYESDYKEYVGDQNYVITFGQNVVNRGDHCRYDIMRSISRDYNFKLFGPNNNVSPLDCGEINYESQLEELSKNKVYFYSGTWPASYTLNFIESLMSGIPVVALGRDLASKVGFFPYEVPDIINNGNNGFCLNDINQIKDAIRQIMTDSKFRKMISENGKKTASKLFGVETVKPMWKSFLDSL